MRHSLSLAVAGALLAVGFVSTATADVDAVIDKYVEARGGREAWEAVESMKVTGEFTAFSIIKPFTLQRTQDDRYHLNHHVGEKAVVIGYDGNAAWWVNEWFGESAQAIEGPDLAVVMRDFEFKPPLMIYKEQGFDVVLLGDVEVDGIPAIGLELTREDESKETWYLDPSSHLEIARDSPGSDFGRPMQQRTWYDDFREVGDIVVPYFTETQWYTRDRVMTVENVELNVAIDEAIFAMPAPTGMGPLQTLAGSWQVSAQSRPQPGADFTPSERQSTIEPILKGALLREHYTTPQGGEVYRSVSYDAARETYRMTEISDQFSFLDVLEGEMSEDGRLTVSNIETGTPLEMQGMVIHARVSFFDITDDAFKIEYELSIDGGENWWVALKSDYVRAAEMAEAGSD